MKDTTKTDKSFESAKTYNLKNLIDYSEGSVVSRTITKGKTGSITLFAFDAGQDLSEHTAPFDALVYVLDGEVVLTVGGKKVVAAEGEAVMMPAGIPHAVLAEKRFKMLLSMIRKSSEE